MGLRFAHGGTLPPSTIPDNFSQLPVSLVRELLQGHTSVLMENAERDRLIRQEIGERLCPKCNRALSPTTPRDPRKIFSGASTRLVGQCLQCRYREDVADP